MAAAGGLVAVGGTGRASLTGTAFRVRKTKVWRWMWQGLLSGVTALTATDLYTYKG